MRIRLSFLAPLLAMAATPVPSTACQWSQRQCNFWNCLNIAVPGDDGRPNGLMERTCWQTNEPDPNDPDCPRQEWKELGKDAGCAPPGLKARRPGVKANLGKAKS